MITATVKHNDNYADIEFPCSEAYLSAKLMEIHVDDLSSITHYISAITEPNELSFLKDKMINLDEINYLAKRMDSFFGDEETQFFEAIKLEHFTEMKDLINLTFNLDKYTLIKDVSDMGKVGREYLLNTEGCIPAHDEDNPKYAEIGRELLRSGRGIFTEHGLLFHDQNRPFEELYNGKTFPAYILSVVALVQLHFFIPATVTLCYGFLTIRMDDTTVLDFIKYAVRYFISTQQYFEWR